MLIPAAIAAFGAINQRNSTNKAIADQKAAADQATAAQNQLNQQTVIPLYNMMMGDYQKNIQPLEPSVLAQMQQAMQAFNSGQIDQKTLAALTSPQGRDAATGINQQQLTNNALNYSSNPGATFGGINGVGGQALGQFLNPNTNLARTTPNVMDYFRNTGNTSLSKIAPQAMQYLMNPQQTMGRQLGAQNLDYFTNPQGTNLAQGTPGFQQSMQGPGQTGATGAGALGYFQNLMNTGQIDPAIVNQALQHQQTSFNRNINDILSKGDGLANRSGTIKDIADSELGHNADMLANIAGQGQALRTQGAEGAMNTAGQMDQTQMQRGLAQLQAAGQLDAQTASYLNNALQNGMQIDAQTLNMIQNAAQMSGNIDQQRSQMMSQLPGLASGMDQQTMQRMGMALNTAGGIDSNTMNMLNNAFGIGSGASQTQVGNMQSGQGIGRDALNQIMWYINQGRATLPGITAGIQGLSSQYGAAASTAANNAYNTQANSTNPFSSVANMVANYKPQQPSGNSGGFGGGSSWPGGGSWSGGTPTAPAVPGYTPGFTGGYGQAPTYGNASWGQTGTGGN